MLNHYKGLLILTFYLHIGQSVAFKEPVCKCSLCLMFSNNCYSETCFLHTHQLSSHSPHPQYLFPLSVRFSSPLFLSAEPNYHRVLPLFFPLSPGVWRSPVLTKRQNRTRLEDLSLLSPISHFIIGENRN